MFQGFQNTSAAPISRFLHLIKAFRESKFDVRFYIGAFLFQKSKKFDLIAIEILLHHPFALNFHSSFPLILQVPTLPLSGYTLVDANQHHKQTNSSQLRYSLATASLYTKLDKPVFFLFNQQLTQQSVTRCPDFKVNGHTKLILQESIYLDQQVRFLLFKLINSNFQFQTKNNNS